MSEYKNNRNPILPIDIHIPDGEAHVMPDGKLYIYGSYDDMGDEYCSEKYRVVSTEDMEHWKIYDTSFEGTSVPWFYDPSAPKYQGIDWTKPTPFLKTLRPDTPIILEEQKEWNASHPKPEKNQNKERQPAFLYAPDAIHKDGKYYLYFCMSDNSEGVAVSDKPEGPFENPVQLPCGGIDPAVFVDTDGQAYYYWGQLFANGVKLNRDMVSFDESTKVPNLVTEEEHGFHEGASMRKIGDTYYLVYSDMERGRPTALGYATSKSPLGPFTYGGIIVDNAGCDPVTWNNHGSIEEFNGEWYVFYHRCSRCTRTHRRLCIEPIHINADGSIDEVKMTSQGAGKPFVTGEKIYGYQACELSGTVYIDVDGQGSEWLTNISPKDEIVFRYVETQKGFSTITLDAEGNGCIDCYLDENFVGSVNVVDGNLGKGELSDRIKENTNARELRLVIREAKCLRIQSIVLKE